MRECAPPRYAGTLRSLFVVGALIVVHPHAVRPFVGVGETGHAAGKRKEVTTVRPAPDRLPLPVQDMIGLIREAAEAGDIEVLRDAIDWNEMKPDFGADAVKDPIAQFKALSADGSGRDILRLLKDLLEGAPAVVPYGRDVENNRLFVWPRLAEQPLTSLSSDDLATFERLVPDAAARAAMVRDGRYGGWRFVLGADGTWHTFRRDN